MHQNNLTLEYYDQNAAEYVSSTLPADMTDIRRRFMGWLPPGRLGGGVVLDFGCGSGRDTKVFLEAGHHVDAIDGSAELCALASAYTGIKVRHMLFSEFDKQNWYDGIWANASLLHLPKKELAEVAVKLEKALIQGGILFASFKYGDFEGMRDGRYYTDFTEKTLRAFWEKETTMVIEDIWVTEDYMPEKREVQWVNMLARKARRG